MGLLRAMGCAGRGRGSWAIGWQSLRYWLRWSSEFIDAGLVLKRAEVEDLSDLVTRKTHRKADSDEQNCKFSIMRVSAEERL